MAQERTPDCSLGKGLWTHVESLLTLASSNSRHLLLIGLVAQPLCELQVQSPPSEPSLRADFPPFTVQVTGSSSQDLQ